MKKFFAVFCALCLMPTFSVQAWIGGPFSGNSFFGEDADDGVYEAVAFPLGDLANGIGIYRWGVSNSSAFPEWGRLTVTSSNVFPGPPPIVVTQSSQIPNVPTSSNIYFGGAGRISHSWFIEGISYRGTCQGTVNSGLGSISCSGEADGFGIGGFSQVSSGFKAKFDNSGEGLPVSRFSGRGRGMTESSSSTGPDVLEKFKFIVMGSKVSSVVSYSGVRD